MPEFQLVPLVIAGQRAKRGWLTVLCFEPVLNLFIDPVLPSRGFLLAGLGKAWAMARTDLAVGSSVIF
jgi:hypothetical protein